MREAHIELVVGMPGVGKTYLTKQIIEKYVKIQQRPVLIFDINGGEYDNYETIEYDANIESIQDRGKELRKFIQAKPHIRRIVPFVADKGHLRFMTVNEMRGVFEAVAQNVNRSLVLFEDINKFETRFQKIDFVSTFASIRHGGGSGKGNDLILQFQSIGKVPTSLWQNANLLRIHNTSDNPNTYSKRIPNFFLVQVAWLIIGKRFREALAYLREREISYKDYKYVRQYFDKEKSTDLTAFMKGYGLEKKDLHEISKNTDKMFTCVWVDLQANQLSNATEEEFANGVKGYYEEFDPRKITNKMKLEKCSKDEAIRMLVENNRFYLDLPIQKKN